MERARCVLGRARFYFFLVFILPFFFAASPGLAEAADLDLENDLQDELVQTRKIVHAIRGKQDAGLSTSRERGQLKALSEKVAANHMLLKERFRMRDEKVKRLGSKAVERQAVVKAKYLQALEKYLALMKRASSKDDVPQSVIDDLQSLLDTIVHKKNLPILGSLPYRHLNYPAVTPITSPTIIPAYRGGNGTVAPEDTASTDLAPITLEIANLAQSLNWSPVLIYEYVKNNVETEWYWGCMKGAEETLRQKSGNDCDQATLLAALLRASDYPTRFVRGEVELFPDIEKAKNLTGVTDPAKLNEFFQKAGIPHEIVTEGPMVKNVRIDHLYVESLIPYSNYRGAIMDDQGKIWLGLDTSLKVKGYSYNNPPGIPSDVPLENIRDEYLGAVQTKTPLEYLEERLTTAGHQPSDFMLIRTLIPQVMNILPSSLQFKEIAITNEYTAIPSDLVHKVNFTANDPGNNELFTITLDAPKLSSHKVTLSYEPESVDDQEIINSFGGLDNTPAYLVHLRPVLMLDGERVIVATAGVAMGGDYDLTISVISPNGMESFIDTMISGNMTAIGIVNQKAIIPTALDDKVASNLLYREAVRYIDNWSKGEDELASLFHVMLNRPAPTVATLGNAVEVTYLLDQPHGMTWKGLFVDADLKATEAVNREASGGSGNDPEKTFMQLSALQSSALEHKLFEDAFQVNSISTAKLFGLANSSQPPVSIVTIDQSNITAILPTLPFADNIKADITGAVNNENLIVRIPQTEMTYQNWSGVGYIKENTTTGEAGYMLSGSIAGGMTAVSPSNWTDQSFVDVLDKPYRENNKRIMITSPQDGATVSYSPIDVTGILLDAGPAVTVNGISAEVTGTTFTAYGIKLNPWENLISADSVSATGVASHDSIAIIYKIPLQVSILFPYDNSNLAVTPVFIEGAVTDPTASVTVNNVKATVLSDGRFMATNVPLYEGANPITVTAMNKVGETATSTITLNYHAVDPQPALAVSITSPSSGATINNEAVTVSGTVVSGAQEVGIRINGVLAEIYNGQFNANNVPLNEGSNVIIADAMDANGAIARAQITVTANTTTPHVTLSSNIQSGVAPLTTYFSVKTNIQNPITSYQLDFGDGSAPYTGAMFDNVSHTYTAEGVSRPSITVTDSQGNIKIDTVAITVQSNTQLDNLLKEKWSGMKSKLANQDIGGAVTYFHSSTQDRYKEIFTTISTQLPQIVQDMQDIQLIYARDSIAKYRIRKNELYGGQTITITYYIYFTKDAKGIWKISQL